MKNTVLIFVMFFATIMLLLCSCNSKIKSNNDEIQSNQIKIDLSSAQKNELLDSLLKDTFTVYFEVR